MPIIDILDLRLLGRGEVARLTEGIAVTQVALVEVVEGLRTEDLKVIDLEAGHWESELKRSLGSAAVCCSLRSKGV